MLGWFVPAQVRNPEGKKQGRKRIRRKTLAVAQKPVGISKETKVWTAFCNAFNFSNSLDKACATGGRLRHPVNKNIMLMHLRTGMMYSMLHGVTQEFYWHLGTSLRHLRNQKILFAEVKMNHPESKSICCSNK